MAIVLYADDDHEHRVMMHMVLRGQGIILLEAKDGYEAVRLIEQERPDLIILDLFMPLLDGFGVLRIIKAKPSTRDIPVIVLSAWPTGDNRNRAKMAGAAGFVAKPYEPQALTQVIKQTLAAENRSTLTVNRTRPADG
jgi:CheY-like chemotaxis protein